MRRNCNEQRPPCNSVKLRSTHYAAPSPFRFFSIFTTRREQCIRDRDRDGKDDSIAFNSLLIFWTSSRRYTILNVPESVQLRAKFRNFRMLSRYSPNPQIAKKLSAISARRISLPQTCGPVAIDTHKKGTTIPRNSFVLAAFALEPDQLSPTLLADAALVPFAGFNCCKNGLAIKTTYAILMGGTFRELLEDRLFKTLSHISKG